jgi:serine/threonine protein kinase/formylglycine-generating enzyme required for sulfatase activity
MPEWLGKTIGKVRIEKLLARGGMAEVYLGSHLTLERAVAVKVLHSFVEEEPLLIERFHREAKVVAGLRHPNIVQILDFDTIDAHPYIVMEYLKGPTLATYLRHLHQRKKRIPPDQVARLMNELSNALDYAHAQGVVHRDIKPGNIMLLSRADEIPLDRPLTDDVGVVVTDFGLVRIMNTASHTMSGTVSGTPAYMSPEQARGDQLDHRTDIYSLGVVLYEMLAGRVPFEADSTLTVLHMQIHAPPPPIQGIPAKLQDVIDRALSKKPEDRYQSARELTTDYARSIGAASAEVIHDATATSPVPVEATAVAEPLPKVTTPKPTSKEDRTVAAPPQPAEAEALLKPEPVVQEPSPRSKPAPEEPEPRPRPARFGLWIGAGLFILLLAAGGYFLFAGQKKPLPPTATVPPVATASAAPSEPAEIALPPATNMEQIPAGSYEVGRNPADENHIAAQNVELKSFWIDQYQITNEEYQQYLAQTGAAVPLVWPPKSGHERHPVRGVTWDQAAAYCASRNKRLPTEAEWEAAGRGPGPAPRLYPWGTDPTAGGSTLNLPSQDTYEVGGQPFNVTSPWKVYDMLGNVWEWVGEPYPNSTVPAGQKILRGTNYGNILDLAFRIVVAPDDTRYIYDAGFRCAADQTK